MTVVLALTVGIQGVSLAAPTQDAGASSWAPTRTHAAFTVGATFNGNATDQEPVSIAIALKLRNEDALHSYIHDLFRPGSPSYHHFLSTKESVATYAPTQQQAQAVVDYLTANGFTHVRIAPNRLVISADGTIGAARNAFRTEIAHFTRDGHSGIANTTDIQIPANLSGAVDHVLGLQTLNRMHTFSVTRSAYQRSASGTPAYAPQEYATVYHAGNTPTGTGTTVALIGWGNMSNPVSDLSRMEQSQGLAAVPTSIESTSTDSSNDDSEQLEWAMDSQAIVGISGGVRNLIFYTTGLNYVQDPTTGSWSSQGANNSELLRAINLAVSDNTAKVINMSWGLAECRGSPGFADSAFQLGVAQGQTFVAATGDNGSYPCNSSNGSAPRNGQYSDIHTRSVNYPASSPYVVAVGGTTLNTSSSDVYISESTWPYSGGGISSSESTPNWQSSSYPYRELPDLAFDADPGTGILLYLTQSSTSGIQQTQFGGNAYGGTSLSAPLFVGAWARLETANRNSMGFAAPAIYSYSSSFPFHDVTTGNNGYYSARTGWDNATGWGSFDIQAVNDFITRTPGFVSATNSSSR
ncbi:S53 family peptidase [Burkholderia cenocepacia]|uniref:S53 family peptidase n=1 Tax=Burkholderia cenocepacia TaxID=95486 RepID=UPI002AB5E167|nr:S53 family peptidase [Burkholderia cenocepacia]